MKKEDLGLWAENRVAGLLEEKGYRILERRVRFREGEIDLIAERDGSLLFVEVKARRSRTFGDVVESVTAQKVLRLRRAISKWRMRRGDGRPGRLVFVGLWKEFGKAIKMEVHFME